MGDHHHEHENDINQMGGFLAGLLIGGLAGAVAMLLLAPQAGKKTRTQIRHKSIELREQAAKNAQDALAQTRAKARQITADVREQADALQQHGQAMLDEQKENWSALVQAGKTAVQG